MDWHQRNGLDLFLLTLVLATSTEAAGPKTNGSVPTPTTAAPQVHAQNACKKEQTKYVYTECDISGGRWRVQVPLKPNSCKIENPEKPERGTDCSFTCPEGQYLNIDTQKCQKCQAGTFSLSGGVRFRTWKDLPSGFSTWGENGDDDTGKITKRKCAGKIWATKGDYIESAGDYCKSVLAYSVTLKKDGNVSLVYRAADDMAFFHVKIVNDFCTTTKGGKHHFYLNPEMRWKRTYVPLKRGRNVIMIEAAYFYDSEDTSSTDSGDFDSGSTPASSGDGMEGSSDKKNRMKSVQIREIKITGLSYTSECTKCEPGTYSPAGAAGCVKCDENTFSKEGALSCTKCASDEYSAKGSSKCTKKPKCSEKDFYEMWSECDENGKTKKSNFWVLPKICDGGAPLPKAGEEKDCPPCNPGQFKNGSSCSFCDSDKFSDGKNGCKKCPPSTSPNLGYYFRWWQNIPKDTLHFYCISKSDRSCKTNIGWRQFNTYMDTGIGHADDAETGLLFRVPGFKDDKATIVLEYETHCTSLCTFILESTKELAGRSVILKQHGRQRKTKFTHHIDGKEAIEFRIRFMKSEGDPANSYDYPEDRLNLYALNITHTLGGGGADHCTECPLGLGNQNGCVQCEAGSYLENKQCKKCPKGTYLDLKKPVGPSACLPCPKWTTSEEGATRCYSDCHLYSDAGYHFDFTPLAGTMQRKNSKSFTSHGYPFYRVFNITICGGPNDMSKCTNNFTKGAVDEAKNKKLASIKSMVCRSTIIPSHEKKKNIVAQSMSLGDYLDSILFGDPHKIEASKNESKVEVVKKGRRRIRRDENDVNDTQPLDVNFIFKSRQPTSRCPDGYSTIVTVRCDPMAAKRGHIRTHEDCSSGTCDGCLYHLFWHSTYACPLCSYSDYQNITSACTNGKVRTHHVWNYPKLCRDGVKLPASVTRACSVFERTVLDLKVFLFVFLGMGLILIILIVVLCYRNRRLTYKYSRLVDEAHYKDGELPASEKCTYDDGEEEDEIILSRGPTSNGRRILDRIKSKIGSPKNRDEFAEFETINLTDRIRHNSSGDEI